MSNYLTIAVVTATICDLIQAAVSEAVPHVTVRIGPPKAATSNEAEVCLYLYHLTPNAQLRNAHVPTRRPNGTVLAQPQAAVDLHYLIAFSGETHLATEVMLGKVITVLESRPVLTGQEIREIVRANGNYAYLKDSDLPAQLDRIKLTPEYLTLEEMTKLWSVFFQIAHRPSLQYIATPVLLDSGDAVVPSPPADLARASLAFDGSIRDESVLSKADAKSKQPAYPGSLFGRRS